MKAPFWQTKTLSEMTREEWESLCDGCGLCCLQKLQDDDTNEVYYTDLHCRYRQEHTHQCTIYHTRNEQVPECVWLTPEQANEFFWLPKTCAYRVLAEGKPLPDWHYLVCGDKQTVHQTGISLKGKTVADDTIAEEMWMERIICKA